MPSEILPPKCPKCAIATDGGLAKMLAEAVKAECAERYAASSGDDTGALMNAQMDLAEILAIIDSLPTLSTADHIAIAICGAKETEAGIDYEEGAEESTIRLHYLTFGWIRILTSMAGENSAFLDRLDDFEQIPLSPPIAALARATWTRLDAEKPEAIKDYVPSASRENPSPFKPEAINALHGGPVNTSAIPNSSEARRERRESDKQEKRMQAWWKKCLANRSFKSIPEVDPAMRVDGWLCGGKPGGPDYRWLPALLDGKPGWRRVEGKA